MAFVQEASRICDHCKTRYPAQPGLVLEGWLRIEHWTDEEDREEIEVCPKCVVRVRRLVRGIRRS